MNFISLTDSKLNEMGEAKLKKKVYKEKIKIILQKKQRLEERYQEILSNIYGQESDDVKKNLKKEYLDELYFRRWKELEKQCLLELDKKNSHQEEINQQQEDGINYGVMFTSINQLLLNKDSVMDACKYLYLEAKKKLKTNDFQETEEAFNCLCENFDRFSIYNEFLNYDKNLKYNKELNNKEKLLNFKQNPLPGIDFFVFVRKIFDLAQENMSNPKQGPSLFDLFLNYISIQNQKEIWLNIMKDLVENSFEKCVIASFELFKKEAITQLKLKEEEEIYKLNSFVEEEKETFLKNNLLIDQNKLVIETFSSNIDFIDQIDFQSLLEHNKDNFIQIFKEKLSFIDLKKKTVEKSLISLKSDNKQLKEQLKSRFEGILAKLAEVLK